MNSWAIALYRYRHFVTSSIVNDIKSRFARSRLGALWVILQPLAQVAIFAIVLSEVLMARLPGIESKFGFAIYLTAGLMAWSLFSEIVLRSSTVFIDNANLLKKISFPRICLPVVVAGTALVNNAMLFLAILVVFALLGHWAGVAIAYLPLLVLVTTLFAVGLGLFLGVLNVFVRDVGQVTGVVIQLWFWLTPIVYPANIIPEQFRAIVALNPMTHVVAGYQNVLLRNEAPDLQSLLVPLGLSFVLMFVAFLLFRRASAEMVDVL
ncbi:ABC transporter permease [Luteimonas abyssi]|uniref:ABC transporter permease n=1 Tax=Luteimonas abyssi TaxID=1247514 RepID=UPI000737B4BF|nr:ABC transporter permease [Luteimonas abyssi]